MYLPKNSCGKLEWFAGNAEALRVYQHLVDVAHIWDDLIDRDKDVSADDVNYVFAVLLCILPGNGFWRLMEPELRSFWPAVLASYAVANAYETAGTEHKLEVSHGLRYAVGQVFTYMVVRLHGFAAARPVLEEMWLCMMPERFDAYKEEHCK